MQKIRLLMFLGLAVLSSCDTPPGCDQMETTETRIDIAPADARSYKVTPNITLHFSITTWDSTEEKECLKKGYKKGKVELTDHSVDIHSCSSLDMDSGNVPQKISLGYGSSQSFALGTLFVYGNTISLVEANSAGDCADACPQSEFDKEHQIRRTYKRNLIITSVILSDTDLANVSKCEHYAGALKIDQVSQL